MGKFYADPGDHLRVDRGEYDHHGIYIGGGSVIHYDGGPFSDGRDEVCSVRVESFSSGDSVQVVQHPVSECLPPKQVVEHARSRLGEAEYSLVSNNCEQFAIWCKTGEDGYGHQVGGKARHAATGAAAGVAVGGAVGLLVGALLHPIVRRPRAVAVPARETPGWHKRVKTVHAGAKRVPGAEGESMITSDGHGGAWIIDAEGEVWHMNGAERTKVAKGYSPSALIASDLKEGAWVLDTDGQLWHIGRTEKLIAKGHVTGAKLAVSKAGEAWVLDGDGELWHYTRKKEKRVSKGYVSGASITTDGEGGVWILDGDGELWHATRKRDRKVADGF
jgi:hypothetical protein